MASPFQTEYSVVMPAYNAALTIGDAVASILSQSLPPRCIIIVDDGSTDDTARVVAALPGPIRLLHQANQGCGPATSTGLAMVDSPLVAMLDADDLWLPGKIERQLEFLAANPDVAGVFGRGRVFRDGFPPTEVDPVAELWSRTTIMMWTEAARSVGPMIEPPGGRGDMVDWLSRAREAGLQLRMIDDIVALRRIRPGSLAFGRNREKDAGYLHVVKAALDRRRGKGTG